MSYAKTLKTILAATPHLFTIKEHTSFGQILQKITSKNFDFVLVKKPIASQMAAVLTLRLLGYKFFWIQKFTNPPATSFLTRLLLAQADRIIAKSKEDATKLKTLGLDKNKVKVNSQSEA